jgi:hypothetical protein
VFLHEKTVTLKSIKISSNAYPIVNKNSLPTTLQEKKVQDELLSILDDQGNIIQQVNTPICTSHYHQIKEPKFPWPFNFNQAVLQERSNSAMIKSFHHIFLPSLLFATSEMKSCLTVLFQDPKLIFMFWLLEDVVHQNHRLIVVQYSSTALVHFYSNLKCTAHHLCSARSIQVW